MTTRSQDCTSAARPDPSPVNPTSRAEDGELVGIMFTSLGPYGALDHHFTVDADRRVAPSIAALLRPSECVVDPRRRRPTGSTQSLALRAARFVLSHDGAELGSALDEHAAVELLLWNVDQAALHDSDRYVFVHASAAEQ